MPTTRKRETPQSAAVSHLTATYTKQQLEHQLGGLKSYLAMVGSEFEEMATIKGKSTLKGDQLAAAYAAAIQKVDEKLWPEVSVEAMRQRPFRPLIQVVLRREQVDFSQARQRAVYCGRQYRLRRHT